MNRAFSILLLLALLSGNALMAQAVSTASIAGTVRDSSGGTIPGAEVTIYLSEERTLLAVLPETTFFGRYRETFV